MRPDEHKKKRSAQYQRKHGDDIKAGKNEKDKTPKSGKTSSAKRDASGPDKRSTHPHPASTSTVHQQSRPSISKDKDAAEVSTSDSTNSEDEEREIQKRFSRRKITSNWAKYDLPPAEAESTVTQKGKDISKLLETTGSAAAHFQFKDEENWTDKGTPAISGTHFLSLDCNQLANSLDCLPFYIQMNLDRNIFTLEQLSSMEQKADNQRAAAGLPPLCQTQIESFEDSEPEPVTDHFSALDVKPSSDDVAKEGVSHIVSDCQPTAAQQETLQEKRLAKTDASETNHDGERLLDRHDEREHPRRADIQVCPSHLNDEKVGEVCSSSVSALEQDLDSLLAADSTTPLVSSENFLRDQQRAAESVDLEDWLDSVLS